MVQCGWTFFGNNVLQLWWNNDNLLWFIWPKHTVEENCALLSYYAMSSGNSLPTFQDTTTRCVTAQKSAVLICFTVEARNHTQQKIKSNGLCWFFSSVVAQSQSEEEINTKLTKRNLHNIRNRNVHDFSIMHLPRIWQQPNNSKFSICLVAQQFIWIKHASDIEIPEMTWMSIIN